ncbi:MAG: efflux RND transporter periplasmic adaptor subunit [candidate division Zixibacteria bacterium]|nr:efflux RND transporter periplasmic adaptor subunit [candidate division Zixibacteria bacterium]
MLKKVILIGTALIVIIILISIFFRGSASKNNKMTLVKVVKGDIVEKALAIGGIVPENEIAVKSKISGIVEKIFVEIGDKIKKGDPLIEISPSPTPLELTEAKRNAEMAEVGFETAEVEQDRFTALLDKKLVSQQEYEIYKKNYDEAKLRLKLASERLSLIEKGKTELSEEKMESIIKSPINGTVLEKKVNEGDPVVPLTSYQEGTELMSLAYMENLVFKGTVDEIDVGKLKEGMNTEIKVGAIPDDTIQGVLYKISPKAKKEENATLFDVEIKITKPGRKMLRAGYSANAEVIINKKENVLLLPERLVEFKGDSTLVEMKNSKGEIEKVPVKIGLSDGLNIEIAGGLKEGDEIIERPPREIK